MAEPESSEQRGRVTAVFGSRCEVESEPNRRFECTLPRQLAPVCGDSVTYRIKEDGEGHLVAVEPRRNSFPRVDRRGRPRVIAANLDVVLVVLACEPAPTRFIVDRYLVAIHSVGMEAVLVANKADLDGHGELMQRLSPYAALGYPLVETCAKTELGMDQLRANLHARTGILVGQSGVGKSRIARCLLPGVDIASDALSRATGKGRHTTTTARLFHLPQGGSLVDTPGVWEYGLWQMPRETIESGFVEFRPFLGQCRFRDCRHLSEPGCAVREAGGRGDISERRMQAYRQILGEMAAT